jgi:hypothetical protein
MACASTVAVVVPSPATSLVFEATSLTIWAPMFSSFVLELDLLGDGDAVLGDEGEPKLFSITTLRPLGPRVTLTALARASTPRRIGSAGVARSR